MTILSSRILSSVAPHGRRGGGRLFVFPSNYLPGRKSVLLKSSSATTRSHYLRTTTTRSAVSSPLRSYSLPSFQRAASSTATTARTDDDDHGQESSRPQPEQKKSASGDSSYGLYSLLNNEERQCLQEQRELVKLAETLASRVNNLTATNSNKSRSLLEDLSTFSIVIAGEFNAGKSTLINALLGSKVLESGALPTTDMITIVSHDKEQNNQNDNRNDNEMHKNMMGVDMYTSSLPLLEDLTLVDTPGTNSTWLDHTTRTLNLLPAADLILFVTSADRPFSESEKLLLEQIQKHRKNIVVIINKMDILETSGGDHGREQKQAIVDFVTDHASELLGARPVIIPISSRDALSAKLMEKSTATISENHDKDRQQRSNVWYRSNFQELETFLYETLTTTTKLKSKLLSPIGVAEGTIEECLTKLAEQQDSLQEDIATLALLENQFTSWEKQLAQDLDMTRTKMTSQIIEQGQRCDLLLSKLNIIQFHSCAITNNNQLQQEWDDTKRQLLISSSSTGSSTSAADKSSSLEADLLHQVEETADSIATRGRAQGQAVIEYLGKRPAMKNQSLVGTVTAASRYEDTRKILNERLSYAVTDTLQITSAGGTSQDEEEIEKIRLFSSLRQIALLSTMFQMGAIGTTLTTLGGITNNYPLEAMIAATSCAISGIATYIGGTSLISKSYQNQWSQRSQRFDAAISNIFTNELDRMNHKILDGISPYTRYVESEQERISHLQEECQTVLTESRRLKKKINKIMAK